MEGEDGCDSHPVQLSPWMSMVHDIYIYIIFTSKNCALMFYRRFMSAFVHKELIWINKNTTVTTVESVE